MKPWSLHEENCLEKLVLDFKYADGSFTNWHDVAIALNRTFNNGRTEAACKGRWQKIATEKGLH